MKKKLIGISLIVILTVVNLYGEGVEKGTGSGLAVGQGSNAADGSIAIGSGAVSKKIYGISIGETEANGLASNSIGTSNVVNGIAGTGIGYKNNVDGNFTTAIGSENEVDGGSIVAGFNNSSKGKNNVTIGAKNTTKNSIASVGVGVLTDISSNRVVAIGHRTTVSENSEYGIAIGARTYIGKLNSEPKPDKKTEPSTAEVSVIKVVEEVSKNAKEKSKYFWSTVIGADAKSFGYQNTSIGAGAESYKSNGVAIGLSSRAKDDFTVAVGSSSTANGYKSVSLGYGTTTVADKSLALGSDSTAYSEESVALGFNSSSKIEKGQFGYDVLTGNLKTENEILGKNRDNYLKSINDVKKLKEEEKVHINELNKLLDKRDEVEENEVEKEALKKEIIAKSDELSEFREKMNEKIGEANRFVSTWKSTSGGVSVGNYELGLTRQINNLAAGTKDTDAVNVAQLKQVKEYIDSKSESSNRGIANAIAIANLGNLSENKFGVSASIGYFKNSSAFALGVAGKLNDKIGYKISGSLNNKYDLGFGIGLTYSFDKVNKDNSNLESRIEKLEKQNQELINIIKSLMNK